MNIFKNIFLWFSGILIAACPILFFIGIYLLLNPITFWQKLVLFLLCFSILGPLEILCFGLGVGIIILLGESSKDNTECNFDNRIAKY